MGIIGIVAAMTIPTLITNNQEKGWDVSASTFEAKFGQALKVMNTQNTLAGLGSTENFVAELQRHMKIVKTCDNTKLTECFTSQINGARSVIDVADKSTWNNNESKPTQVSLLKKSNNIGQKTWGTNTMGLQFANGVSAIVAYNPKCTSDPFNTDAVKVSGDKDKITFTTDCVAVVYDTQSFKNPNELHKDIRTSSMATVGDGNCVFKIDGKCVTKTPSVPMPHTWNACDENGSTTDPDDLAFMNKYKINKCMNPNNGTSDYWAGAADEKFCDGTSKIASMEDLGKIATYIYNDDSIGAYNGYGQISGVTFDATKGSKLGLPPVLAGIFLWGMENSTDYAHTRHFYLNSTHTTLNYRSYWAALAICVE